MRRLTWLVTCTVLFSATGCVICSEPTLVRTGVYREPSEAESVVVRGQTIEFHVRVPRLDPEKVFCRAYLHTVDSNGWIRIVAPSNDSVFVFGVNRYGWLWDGHNIVRKDPTGQGAMVFAPEPKATNEP